MIKLILGDCLEVMKGIPDASVDAIITDPPYPEVDRDYGRMTEAEWHQMMRGVVAESRRVLKPTGSAVFILQPNSRKVGSMRLWLWEFILRAGREWNLIQDVYWWNIAAMPTVHCQSVNGLMRPSLKACVWLGNPECYRQQHEVLWGESESNIQRRISSRFEGRIKHPSGQSVSVAIFDAAVHRGGVTPFNVLPIPNTNSSASAGSHGHGAGTPQDLADWWTRYICPPSGTICDPFMGSGTTGLSALKYGRDFVGIEKHEPYFRIAERRIKEAERRKDVTLAPPLDRPLPEREPCPRSRIARSSSSSQDSPATASGRQMVLFSL